MSESSSAKAHRLGIDISHWPSQSNVVRIDPVKDWPASRQLALMFTRKSEMVKSVTRVLERGTAKPGEHDWRWLSQNNFTTRWKTDEMPHSILVCTLEGAAIADQLAMHHARTLDMHVFLTGKVTSTCSCGWSHNAVIRQGDIPMQLAKARGDHLSSVESGTYRPIGEVMNDACKIIEARAKAFRENSG